MSDDKRFTEKTIDSSYVCDKRVPKGPQLISNISVDFKLPCVKTQYTKEGETVCMAPDETGSGTGLETKINLKSKDSSSRNECNRVVDEFIQRKRKSVHYESPNEKNSEGHKSETYLSERSRNVQDRHIEIALHLGKRSNTCDVRISKVHQSETNSINSSQSKDKFYSGQLELRTGKQKKHGTESDSYCVTTEKSCVSNSNEDEVIVSPSFTSKTRSISQSARAYSNKRIAPPSPANHAEMFHKYNTLQEVRPSDYLLECSEILTTIAEKALESESTSITSEEVRTELHAPTVGHVQVGWLYSTIDS